MKKLFTALMLVLTSGILLAQTSGIAIQLAAFDRAVPLTYFTGIDGVFHTVDHNDIHRYYVGGFESVDAANAKAADLKSTGYNMRVVDLDELRRQCSNSCGIVDPMTIKSIFFDYDKSNLRNASVSELDKLYRLLTQNPSYTTELSAHTDAHGSDDYNVALSQRRAKSAREYLISRGIAPERIQTSTFGEKSPIAKNELQGGRDTAQGRQYNRRVELKIFDESKKNLELYSRGD